MIKTLACQSESSQIEEPILFTWNACELETCCFDEAEICEMYGTPLYCAPEIRMLDFTVFPFARRCFQWTLSALHSGLSIRSYISDDQADIPLLPLSPIFSLSLSDSKQSPSLFIEICL